MQKHLLISIVLCVISLLLPHSMCAASLESSREVPDGDTGSEEKAIVDNDKLAQIGWPAHYGGVMLQGFYWGSYQEQTDNSGVSTKVDTKWKTLTERADSLSKYFDIIWVPNSGSLRPGTVGMGYLHYLWFSHNSSFGTEKELKTMIQTFRQKHTGIIEDVVINHQSPYTNMDLFNFPVEHFNGKTYQLKSTDILRSDEGGTTLREALIHGKQLSQYGEETVGDGAGCTNNLTEDNNAGMDLDHRSANVQAMVKAMEHKLIDSLGYEGFRYDVASGYAPEHIADYNAETHPRFSIGEVWKGDREQQTWWINHWAKTEGGKTYHLCSGFDFPLKYGVINTAFKLGDFSQKSDYFSKNGLVGQNPNLSRYAVTFIDNHDTYWPRNDRSNDNDGPGNVLSNNVLAANAYILAMPGTPCIYYKHWLDDNMRPELKKMIMARKVAGVTNMSHIVEHGYDPTDFDGYYAVVAGETMTQAIDVDGNVIKSKLDNTKDSMVNATLLYFAGDVNPQNLRGHTLKQYSLVSKGENYALYISKGLAETLKNDLATADKAFTYDASAKDYTTYSTDADPNPSPIKANTTSKKVTVRVRMDSFGQKAPALHAWQNGGGDLNGTWGYSNQLMNETDTISGTIYWKKTMYCDRTYSVIFYNENATDNSGRTQIDNLFGDTYFTWDNTNGVATDITSEVIGTTKKNYTIYIRKDKDNVAPYLHAWEGTTNLNGEWGSGQQLTNEVTIDGTTWWYKTVAVNNSYSFMLRDEVTKDDGTTEEFKEMNGKNEVQYNDVKTDIWLTWDSNNHKSADISTSINGDGLRTYTIYVRKDGDATAPCLHVWDDSPNRNGAWGAQQQMTETVKLGSETWWKKDLKLGKTYNVILHTRDAVENAEGDAGAKRFTGLQSDVYLTWDPTNPAESKNITVERKPNTSDTKVTIYVRKKNPDADKTDIHLCLTDNSWKWIYEGPGGETMSETKKLGDYTWYYKAVDPGTAQYNIIFTDGQWGETHQSEDLKNLSGDTYFIWDGGATDKAGHIEKTTGPQTPGTKSLTVFVKKVDGQPAPCLHAWEGNLNLNGESGAGKQQMTETAEVKGETWWCKTLTTVNKVASVKLHSFDNNHWSDQFDTSDDIYLTWDSTTWKANNITRSTYGGLKRHVVYVEKGEKSVEPYVYVFETDGYDKVNGSWGNEPQMPTVDINGRTWWYSTIYVDADKTFNVILHTRTSDKSGQSKTFEKLSDDIYLRYSEAENASDKTKVDVTAEDLTLSIRGGGQEESTEEDTGDDGLSDGLLEEYQPSRRYYVIFRNTLGWKNVHAYVMNSGWNYNYSGNWPGASMTPVTITETNTTTDKDGKKTTTEQQVEYCVWSYLGARNEAPGHVIINAGSENGHNRQTVNIAFNNAMDGVAFEIAPDTLWTDKTKTTVKEIKGKTEENGNNYVINNARKIDTGDYALNNTSKTANARAAKAAYLKEANKVSHTIFFHNTEGWENIACRVYGVSDDKYDYESSYSDYAGGRSDGDVELAGEGGARMDKVYINGKIYWVWNYSGGKLTSDPQKVRFFGTVKDKNVCSSQLDFKDGCIYEVSEKTEPLKVDNGATKKIGDDKKESGELCYTLSASKESNKGMVMVNRLYQRTFPQKGYATVCLPFTLDEGELSSLRAKAFDFTGVDGNILYFERVKTVEPLRPYLFVYYGTSDEIDAAPRLFYRKMIARKALMWPTATLRESKTNTGGDVRSESFCTEDGNGSAVDVKVGNDTKGYWTFHGNATMYPMTKSNDAEDVENAQVVYGYNAADRNFTWVENGTATIPPTVCWFTTARSNGTPTIDLAKKMNVTLLDDGETIPTGITFEPVVNDKKAFDPNAPMYNLAGQRVGKDYKGIVIQNGRKIFRR